MFHPIVFALALVLRSGDCQVECPGVSWSGRGSLEENTFVIPADRINDGYCDCPLTGADEPDTAACAGSSTWAGVTRNYLIEPEGKGFTCPKQPKLKIPLSRVNDGICDCCDGADEVGTVVCKENCDEVLRAERLYRRKLEQKFHAGFEARNKMVAEFEAIRNKTMGEVAGMESALKELEQSLAERAKLLGNMELNWTLKRMSAIDAIVKEASGLRCQEGDQNCPPVLLPHGMEGMIAPLSMDELTWWIIHACQMAGEMEKRYSSKEKTCIPLRLAGLDAGLWWEPQNYTMTLVTDLNQRAILARLLDYNLKNPSQVIWHAHRLPENKETPRRRLEDDLDEYDNDDHYDPSEDGYGLSEVDKDEEKSEYDSRRKERIYNPLRNRDKGESEESETKGEKYDQVLAVLKSRAFSFSRVRFLERSNNLLEMIGKITETTENQDEPSQNEQVAENQPELEAQVQFDPMALPMVKNQLSHRKEAIERGFTYAVSAKVLLDSLLAYPYGEEEHKMDDLRRLAMAVLNHGKIAARNVWQLYLAVVPGLDERVSLTYDPETCVAPWATVCPPKSISRVSPLDKRVNYNLPPIPIVEEALAYCRNLRSDQAVATGSICASDKIIPQTDITDGFFGYYGIYHRSDDDVMDKVFASIKNYFNNSSPERTEIVDYQLQIENMEREALDLKRKITNAFDAVGGNDESTLGRDGELFHLKDQCFSIEAAKYTYELCLFKKAKQKDSGGMATHLGDWSGTSVNSETGERLWNWTMGAKCWNGPMRSATAVVTCGGETKVLTADEPETCRYIFQAESPVACDNEFRARYNL